MSFNKELIEQHAPQAKCIVPMKVWKLPDNAAHRFGEVCESGSYFAQLKKDGYWYQYEKTEDYDYLFSRSVSKRTGILSNKIENVPHIREAFASLPPETIIIGEIFFPDVLKTSKDVTGIMGCLPEEAIRRQEQEEKVSFYIHDIIYYAGTDLQKIPAFTRYKVLQKVCDKYGLLNFPQVILAECILDNIQEFTVAALSNREEGVVLKKKNSPYSSDKRPAWDTIKVKKVDYADAICVGFIEPTRKYEGTELESWEYWVNPVSLDRYPLGTYYSQYEVNSQFFEPVTKGFFYNWKSGIKLGAYLNGEMVNIGSVSSGLTDLMRAECSTKPEKYLMKVCKIQCMEKDNESRTLRHGFFKGMHDSKTSQECLVTDIFI